MRNRERFVKSINWEPVDRLLTYDFVDSYELLVQCGGYDPSKTYTWEELIHINARAYKNMGLDVTRYIYDPANHWMGGKIQNWIRFFRVDPAAWQVSQTGGTAWISKRPFTNLQELEKHMPQLPVFKEVEEWYAPVIRQIQEILDEYDLVFIGAVEGPITDAYSYMDMELFATATLDAPELVSHVMDCCGKFSAYISQVFVKNTQVPLLFMGEDIAGKSGPIFSPRFVHDQGLPRWHWISDPPQQNGMKFLYHSDGKYGEFLPLLMKELNADGLNPIERNGLNDIFEIRAQYPDKLLFGNVCCARTLPYGTVGDVEDETLEIIERLGAQRGIFIGSSSEVHDLVPPENAKTMYATVHEYGVFPVDVDRIRARRAELRTRGELKLRANEPIV